MAVNSRTRVVIIAVVLFASIAALVWFLSTRYRAQPVTPLPPPDASRETVTPPPAPTPAPDATPATTPSPAPQSQATPAIPPTTATGDATRLLIPVAGVRPEQLQDTFDDARSEGRVHDAIDIMAPRHTPVVATADGRVVKLFQSVKGGTTIYQLSTDERTVYYYAHLDAYADGLAEGHVARRGETIGYVGDTGNAVPGNTHLHFQVYIITDPKQFWTGDNLNPYKLLR